MGNQIRNILYKTRKTYFFFILTLDLKNHRFYSEFKQFQLTYCYQF